MPDAEAVLPSPDPAMMVVSIAAQLSPMGRYGNPDGDPLAGTTITEYVETLTQYIAKGLSSYTDPRGGDVFLSVAVNFGDQHAGHQYRSGHYVKEESDEHADTTD